MLNFFNASMTQEEFEKNILETSNNGKILIKNLIINGCSNIVKIPNIKGLKILECINCTKITEIPYIESLEKMTFIGCTNLLSIPSIDRLEKLFISYCLNLQLKSIGYLPNLKKFVNYYIDEINGPFKLNTEEFKKRNLYFYCIKISEKYIKKLLGNSEGFVFDLMKMLENF